MHSVSYREDLRPALMIFDHRGDFVDSGSRSERTDRMIRANVAAYRRLIDHMAEIGITAEEFRIDNDKKVELSGILRVSATPRALQAISDLDGVVAVPDPDAPTRVDPLASQAY